MHWFLGASVLVTIGALLRHVLGLNTPRSPQFKGLVALRPELYAVYHPVAREMETHAAILGISLNDAFEERDSNRHEISWRLVRLSLGEWNRLSDLLIGLLRTLSNYLPRATAVVPVRRMIPENFNSRDVIDHVRLYEFLDQLVFSSKRRFLLQLRLLLRATATLTGEFRRTCRYGEQTLDPSSEVWSRLDVYFHDFDLIAKETLLCLRALLACLPPDTCQDLSADLQALLHQVTRVAVTSPRN
jgi:hypothetical protein